MTAIPGTLPGLLDHLAAALVKGLGDNGAVDNPEAVLGMDGDWSGKLDLRAWRQAGAVTCIRGAN